MPYNVKHNPQDYVSMKTRQPFTMTLIPSELTAMHQHRTYVRSNEACKPSVISTELIRDCNSSGSQRWVVRLMMVCYYYCSRCCHVSYIASFLSTGSCIKLWLLSASTPHMRQKKHYRSLFRQFIWSLSSVSQQFGQLSMIPIMKSNSLQGLGQLVRPRTFNRRL